MKYYLGCLVFFICASTKASVYDNYGNISVISCETCVSDADYEKTALSNLKVNEISLVIIHNDKTERVESFHGVFEVDSETRYSDKKVKLITDAYEVRSNYIEYLTMKALNGGVIEKKLKYPKNSQENSQFYGTRFDASVWADYGTYARNQLPMCNNIFVICMVALEFDNGDVAVLKINPRSTIAELVGAFDKNGNVLSLNKNATRNSTGGRESLPIGNFTLPVIRVGGGGGGGGSKRVVACTGEHGGKMRCVIKVV